VLTSPEVFGSLLRRRWQQARTEHFAGITLFWITA
jgi:hypothetical protein